MAKIVELGKSLMIDIEQVEAVDGLRDNNKVSWYYIYLKSKTVFEIKESVIKRDDFIKLWMGKTNSEQ